MFKKNYKVYTHFLNNHKIEKLVILLYNMLYVFTLFYNKKIIK